MDYRFLKKNSIPELREVSPHCASSIPELGEASPRCANSIPELGEASPCCASNSPNYINPTCSSVCFYEVLKNQ